MTYKIDNPFTSNTLKKINLSSDLYNEFASTLYNDKGYTFGYIFGKYTKH